MAFNMLQFLGLAPQVVDGNMLTQTGGIPVPTPKPQNMLLGGQVGPTQAHTAGMPIIGSDGAGRASSPGAVEPKKSIFQAFNDFSNSDRGQYLNDMFAGWAMGSSPSESLAMGAKLAGANQRERRQTNETVSWLQKRGMDAEGAKMMASNPKALGDYLQQMNNPNAALENEYKRAQIDALRAKPQVQWQKLDDDTLFNPSTGDTRDLAATGPNGARPFRYGGNSVEAQSLNGLMESGRLTPEQAQQLGAGKTITGTNGEIIFMTPNGVFSQPSQGQASGSPVPMSGTTTPAPATPPAAPGGIAPALGRNAGLIPLTAPKNTAGQLPAEMGARIGLGDAFLKELPNLREQITRGDASGPIDGLMLKMGVGKPADIWRNIETGRDALVRNLTGAGMSQSEAENQAARYQIEPTDRAETMLSKLNNLERDLRATREGAIGARTSGLGAAPASSSDPLAAAKAAIARGAPRDAVIQRLRQNGINPEGL
ncbi:hypothetical protein [Rhizobium sp. CC-YZS058]|uniref:hypothetical protein n=1 Tax=Rhizobium sp. CC-YZS058 TaxID=3042153 RepID=UPI002B057F39|nr:hypothetical protein [Rhizobium sp. CC-YZS058]MEA3533230.1 hypothetical protein [Rhizobium sp. CC-YZS058]